MPEEIVFFLLAGFLLAGAFGVLFAPRMGSAAFSLFAMLMGVAGLYALYHVHMAAVAQVILYVGGVMVLIAFALFLYAEPLVPPRLIQFKQHLGKAFILLIISGFLFYSLPWVELNKWAKQQEISNSTIIPSQDLGSIGQNMIVQYSLEYELLGLLLVAAILVSGWFIKSNPTTES